MRRATPHDPVTTLLPRVHVVQAPVDQGYRTLAYAVEHGDTSILIDLSLPEHLPHVGAWAAPSALVLTHRHVRHTEATYEERFGLKVYLHPEDASAPRRGPATGTPSASRYHDPTEDPALRALGFRFFHVPGHTPGHCMIVWDEHDGVLFSGDAVIGPRQTAPAALELPPPPTSDDAPLNRTSIERLALPPVRHVLPLHGDPLLDLSPDQWQRQWRGLFA